MRILIAEDDPVSRLRLQATLKKWGIHPLIACDGTEALALLEQENRPEIAILDWMMPGIDGVEVCRQVRQRPDGLPVYIILLTAKTQTEDLVAGLEAGADDYITKPFNQQELLARLHAGIRIVDLQRSLSLRLQDLEVAMMRLRRLQQAQKLEALGQMSSGVAHEINTPTQYIGDNMRFLKDSWNEIKPVLEREAGNPDFDYLIKEVPKAIEESLQGVQRVCKIVRAMRDFSHSSGENKVEVDINRTIETTITVSTSEWKYVAEIETDLDPNLPSTICFPGELHTVLLNLIINAAHAIADVKNRTHHNGVIRITTRGLGDCIEIRVSDTGTGIPEEHRGKVFEPFFTTKEVGKGTGQGLAISYSAIVQQHNGKIWFESEIGKGTTFVVQLPIDGVGSKASIEHETNLVRSGEGSALGS